MPTIFGLKRVKNDWRFFFEGEKILNDLGRFDTSMSLIYSDIGNECTLY